MAYSEGLCEPASHFSCSVCLLLCPHLAQQPIGCFSRIKACPSCLEYSFREIACSFYLIQVSTQISPIRALLSLLKRASSFPVYSFFTLPVCSFVVLVTCCCSVCLSSICPSIYHSYSVCIFAMYLVLSPPPVQRSDSITD